MSKITITMERYNQLRRAEAMYNALRECGVDNWEGYSDAQEIFMVDVKALNLLTEDEIDDE